MSLFKPKDDLMSQLADLRQNTAKLWYEEYLKYHKGKDQGINYIIGYFPIRHRNMLREAFGFL